MTPTSAPPAPVGRAPAAGDAARGAQSDDLGVGGPEARGREALAREARGPVEDGREADGAQARGRGARPGASGLVAPPAGHAFGPVLHPVAGPAGIVRGLRPVLVDEADVAALVDRLVAAVTDGACLEDMGAPALKDRIAQLRRLSGLADAGLARTVAALDRAGGVASDGAPSKAEWIKANTGRSGREAARTQRLADNLEELPATADALASGQLTSEAADAIVHASRDGRLGPPDDVESDLVPVATTASPEQLRRHIRRRQQQADGAAILRQEQRQRAMRDLALTQAQTGEWNVRGMLPGEVGTKLRTALDAFDHPDPPDAAVKRRPGARLVDALESLVDTVLDNGTAPGTGGVARPHLSVLVDLATIDADLRRLAGTLGGHDGDRGAAAGVAGVPGAGRAGDADRGRGDAGRGDAGRTGGADGAGDADRGGDAGDARGVDVAVAADDPAWADLPPGTTPWDGLVSPQAIRRLLCDASVSRIVTDGPSQVLDVGRATREWSEPQRRAVNARDRGCRGPNCSRPIAWTQIHHIRWWERDRGPTNLHNGIALCHHCHRLVHDRGWTVSLDPATAQATWTSPTGSIVIDLPGDRSPGGRGSPPAVGPPGSINPRRHDMFDPGRQHAMLRLDGEPDP